MHQGILKRLNTSSAAPYEETLELKDEFDSIEKLKMAIESENNNEGKENMAGRQANQDLR